jgi:tRNA uridine 5-carboxymethylaminomethyl modification enzyme
LVLHGVSEPYRMLTARAEYRLRLRADNAETRLTGIAQSFGAVGAERAAAFAVREKARNSARHLLQSPIDAPQARIVKLPVSSDGATRSAFEYLRMPGVSMTDLANILPDLATLDPAIAAELAEDAHYAPYVARQEAELRALQANERISLPPDLDYSAIGGLSLEMVERLSAARPDSLGQAARIAGITPAALTSIMIHVRRRAA